MADADIRWKQRFANYKTAHDRLKDAAAFFEKNADGGVAANVAMEALIKCFEFTFELAWQTMKDFISYNGYVKTIYGSRDAIRAAQQLDLINNGQTWIDMVDDRNRAAHTYDNANAKTLTDKIIERYRGEFVAFEEKMDTLI
jgi:nucleotidyltransferase substrate binding protein (TIGR01987 family)